MRPSKRSSASTNTQPSATQAAEEPVRTPAADLPDELIAARAYEIWRRRGCPMGQDSEQDWHAARAELEEERLGWAPPEAGDRDRRP